MLVPPDNRILAIFGNNGVVYVPTWFDVDPI